MSWVLPWDDLLSSFACDLCGSAASLSLCSHQLRPTELTPRVTDFLIVLNSRAAVANFMSAGSVTLGGNMSVAVGPMGRNAEGSGAVNAKGQLAAMYSYSKTKGLFGGVSLEGTVIAERQDANRLAYGGNPTAKQILTGAFEPPEWAYVLIDVLDRATGLPGGQTWVEDAPERMGAMGWSSPTGSRTGAGYAFGEGVGAGGSKANRKRSSSLFSIGANSNKGRDDSSVFSKTPQTPSPSHTGTGYFNTSGYESRALEDRAPPPRPWEARRASSLIPFSKSMNFASFAKDKDRKMGPSSETYNSAADYSEQRERERRRSSVVRPYKEKPTPSPFVSELDPSRSNTPRSSPPRSFGTRSPVHSNSDSSDRNLSSERNHSGERERDRFADLLGPDDWDNQRTSSYGRQKINSDRDLIGTWEADPHGLTANFSKLSTSDYTNGHSNGYTNGHSNSNGNGFSNGLSPRSTPNRTPNRSRATSRASALAFDPIAEDPSGVRVHETTSAYATRDWALPADIVPAREKKRFFRERKERPFSSYAAPTGWNWRDESPNGTGTGSGREDAGSGSGSGRRGSGGREVDLTRDYDDFSSRPFDDYAPKPRTSAPKPNLALKAGLEGADGYARAVALYDFKATAPGDLALRKGQVVIVLDGDGDAGEWWRGRSAGTGGDGGEGLFPANYVEVLDIPRDLKGGVSRSMLRRRVLAAFDP